MPVPSAITDLSTTAASNSPSGNEAPTTADDYIRAHASFIAQNYSNKLDKAGTVTPTANQPMGGYRHTGAGTAIAAGEYVVWNQSGVRFPSMGIGTSLSSWGASIYAIDIGPEGAIWGAGAAGVRLLSNSYYDGANFRAKATDTAVQVAVRVSDLVVSTMASVSSGAIQTPVERFRVGSDGVRVGNTDPATVYTLNVVGSGAFGSTTGAAVQLSNSSTGRFATIQHDDSQNLTIHNSDNNGTGAIVFKTSTGTGTERMRIENTGIIFTLPSGPPSLLATREAVFSLTSDTNLRISVRGSDGTTRVANITLA